MKLSIFLTRDISFKLTDKHLSLLLIRFKTLLSASVPMSRALDIIEKTEKNKTLKDIIQRLRRSVSEGKLLSQALAEQPHHFDSMLVSTVKAGEATGKLTDLLESMAGFYGRRHDQRQKIQGAMAYPALLFLVTILVITFVLGYVMPSFLVFFEESGQILPLSTRMLIALTEFFIYWGWLVFLVFLFLLLGFMALSRHEGFKKGLDGLVYKLPMVGRLQKTGELTKIAGLLQVLWESGVSTIQALEILEDSITNHALAGEMEEAIRRILTGSKLSDAFSDISIVTPLFAGMLEVGEETGQLPEMMGETRAYYERELAEETQRFMRRIEPAMILIMAAIVGFVVLSIATPMFDLINTTTF